jgi:hypothetical protein
MEQGGPGAILVGGAGLTFVREAGVRAEEALQQVLLPQDGAPLRLRHRPAHPHRTAQTHATTAPQLGGRAAPLWPPNSRGGYTRYPSLTSRSSSVTRR